MSTAFDEQPGKSAAEHNSPLYANRVRVYPKAVAGRFRRLKWIVLVAALSVYYVLPWIRWDRGPDAPRQAVLADMGHARFYFFWIEIWPQEVYYLTGLLLLGALGIFMASSLVGRAWCGYACPQTVWTDLFMWIERRIEGDRNQRMKRDAAGFSLGKAGRKTVKHAVWLIIAAATGGAWIMYFIDAPTVVPQMLRGESTLQTYFFFGLFTATTYLLAGWAREQVCTYMCPWPRFQSAMLDEDSFIVSYRADRGEPRGKLGKAAGDCIDCHQCVAVCPTGIDIRDGLQMECIGCGLCADACDDVMGKIDRPLGLISYDTERNKQLRAAGKPTAARLFRPRTVLYAALFVLIAGIMLWSVVFRATLDLNVLHERSPLYVTLSDGRIRNGYTVKILNMTRDTRTFSLALPDQPAAEIQVVGQEAREGDVVELQGRPDSVATYRVYVTMPRGTQDGTEIVFAIADKAHAGKVAMKESVFRAPAR